MPKLREQISKYLCVIAIIMALAIILITSFIQILSDQKKARDSSSAVFSQIEQIIDENEAELAEVKDEYRRSCLYNAAAISRLIEADESVLDSVDKLKEIAEFSQVDEIHIFDKTGTIVNGTHPEYYNYSFDSGEQMMFFKPMLYDKKLKLVQDITPNTAESKLMQYSAVWSENGEFIVQIGMAPVNVMKVTEKNELSYIFSLLRANTDVILYAVNSETSEIVGSTSTSDNGKALSDIGIDLIDALDKTEGFHAKVNGRGCFCVFTIIDSNLIGWVMPNDKLYENVVPNLTGIAVGLIFIAAVLVAVVLRYTNKYIIGGIYDINEKLRSISNGNLDETVDVRTSLEFSELSDHINEMVGTLLANTDKISYVLNKTNLHIGVYEYNKKMQGVRYTEYLPRILGVDRLEKGEASDLFSDNKRFGRFINKLRRNPLNDAENVYGIDTENEHFVKLDEMERGNDILGIVIDVTDEVLTRRRLEEERDLDSLTGLYNRRGLDNRLAELFAEPEKLQNSAVIMIDADSLKEINDKYGHEIGDSYIRQLSEKINSLASSNCIVARRGGDEFVIFMYGYKSEQELIDSIDTLTDIQNNSYAQLRSDLCVPLKFSFGYSLTKGQTDYHEALKAADEKMYESKRERKSAASPRP